jgi:hypothetical protein
VKAASGAGHDAAHTGAALEGVDDDAGDLAKYLLRGGGALQSN